MHTVSFEVLGSLSKYEFATFYFDKKLVKLQCPLVCEFFREITKFIYYTSSFNIFFLFHESSNEFVHLLKQLLQFMASKCVEVYLELYFILARELESVETSPGFASSFLVPFKDG